MSTPGTPPQTPLDIRLDGPEATARVAQTLAQDLQAGDLLVLTGELGAGKTTFTRALGQGLGVSGSVISPTFVLSRIHPNDPQGPRPGGPQLVHVDAYRLSSVEEVDDLDLEHTQEESVTVVEWGLGLVEHLSPSRAELHLQRALGDAAPAVHGDEEDTDPRTLRLELLGPRWEAVDQAALAQRLRAAAAG